MNKASGGDGIPSWAISNSKRWCCESAALNMPANLENLAVATGLEKVSFHSNPKEGQCQRMFKQIVNRYIKRCSTSLHQENGNQITMRYHLIPIRIILSKKKPKTRYQILVKMWSSWNSCTLLVESYNGKVTMENNMEIPQILKYIYDMIQQSHFWVFILKNWNANLEITSTLLYSL